MGWFAVFWGSGAWIVAVAFTGEAAAFTGSAVALYWCGGGPGPVWLRRHFLRGANFL